MKYPLTWDGDEELDGVPVPVERELRLRHVAVRHEALRRHALRRGVLVHLPNIAAEQDTLDTQFWLL